MGIDYNQELLEIFVKFIRGEKIKKQADLENLLKSSKFTLFLQDNFQIFEYYPDYANFHEHELKSYLRILNKKNFESLAKFFEGRILKFFYSASHYKTMIDNIKDRPYWMYNAVLDSNTRPSHRALHGKIFSAYDPIWNKIYPPSDWNCRCSVMPLDEDDLKEMKVKVQKLTDKPKLFDLRNWWAFKLVEGII